MSSRHVLAAWLPVLALAAGCGKSQGAAPAGGAPRGLPVRGSPVLAQDVVYQIKSPGTMQAEELVQITAQVEGQATAVNFHEGDRVDRGTVLVQIDPDRYRLELEPADANYKRALADAHRAASDPRRREPAAPGKP